ncbi:hypothetical protein BZA05DRAFT_416054 [Tricharina praecox]|uniref:uncharacterized protein n=1 Tax=Tricharina praecox TaxID=43433 RepID=UPI0022207407|nr:uncharacterized protein BZA05DRAFT_416054 [Tricharina praecox]KAI5856358.1 hypothetical protein BZA05DRAFT_416054 [Tricharina praecox]
MAGQTDWGEFLELTSYLRISEPLVRTQYGGSSPCLPQTWRSKTSAAPNAAEAVTEPTADEQENQEEDLSEFLRLLEESENADPTPDHPDGDHFWRSDDLLRHVSFEEVGWFLCHWLARNAVVSRITSRRFGEQSGGGEEKNLLQDEEEEEDTSSYEDVSAEEGSMD